MRALKDINGQRFGNLVVQRRVFIGIKTKQAVWEVKCDCGKLKMVCGWDLRSGHTKSCGCKRHATLGNSHFWKGGRINRNGYVMIKDHDHPSANQAGYIGKHILIAEKALGKRLPANAVVHHVNSDPGDNRPENLVVCENITYHMLLHKRTRALQESGSPVLVKCRHCGKYDLASNMFIDNRGTAVGHSVCINKYVLEKRQIRNTRRK